MKRYFLVLLLISFLSLVVFTQQPNSLRVNVIDQNNQLIKNKTVKLKANSRSIKEAADSTDEKVLFSSIEPGKYLVEIQSQGFKDISQEVDVKVGVNEVTIKLEISDISEEVLVGDDLREKALSSGAFSNFLTKEQLNALPDEPDELVRELKNQFGRDVIITVDGYSGRIPPKSQIASIRVTRSSFDAEYHELGNTFVNIISKAGYEERWLGSIHTNFNDESLNARNTFAVRRFPTQQRIFEGLFMGPIIKDKTSADIYLSSNDTYRQENIFAVTSVGQFRDSVRNAVRNLSYNIKISQNIGKDKVLNISFIGDQAKASNNGIGGVDLPERGFSSKTSRQEIRVSESQFFGSRFLNEIRLQFIDESIETLPLSSKTAIIVLDAFNNGGAGNFRKSRRQNIRFSDNLLFGVGKHQALKIGTLLDFERAAISSAENENGTFIFSSLNDFVLAMPTLFTQNKQQREVKINQFNVGAFVQDDIRISPSFLLSAGLRYEWQNNLKDRNNFSPRLGFAWSPSKKGDTTIRGGAGIYFNWLNTDNLGTILGQSMTRSNEVVITNPDYANPLESGISQILPLGFWRLAPDLKNPYIFLASVAVERQLNKRLFFRAEYKYQKGINQFRSRDVNAPIGLTRPNSDFGRVIQIESTGFYEENSLNVDFNGRIRKNLSFASNYTLSKNISDADGIFSLPSNSYNRRLDRSVSSFDQRHRIYTSLFWTISRNLNFATALRVASPLPYTITTGFDNNSDTIFNDRPFGIERNSARGTWQRQVDTSLSWSFGIFRAKGANKGAPPLVVLSSDEALVANSSPDHRFILKFTVKAYNIFNQTNLINFVGVQTSPLFAKATDADSARRILFGARFSF